MSDDRPVCYDHQERPVFSCPSCFAVSTLWRCRCGDYRLASCSMCLVCRQRRPRLGAKRAKRESLRAAGILIQLALSLPLPEPRAWFDLREGVQAPHA